MFNISFNILFTTLQPNSFKHYRVKIIIMIMMMMIIIIINTIIIIIIIILFFFLSKAKCCFMTLCLMWVEIIGCSLCFQIIFSSRCCGFPFLPKTDIKF